MNPLVSTLIGASVRWLIVAVGVKEYVSDDQQMALVGGIAALGSLGWSLYQKYCAHGKLTDAQQGY